MSNASFVSSWLSLLPPGLRWLHRSPDLHPFVSSWLSLPTPGLRWLHRSPDLHPFVSSWLDHRSRDRQ